MIVVNAAAQVFSLAATLVVQTIYLIVVARVLGPEDFGRFSFAWSVVQILLIGGDFGLHNTALRLISADRRRSQEVCDLFLGLKLMVSVLVLVTVVALAGRVHLGGGGETALVIFGAGAALQSFSSGLNVGFQAHDRLYFASLNILLVFVVQAVLGFTFLWWGGRLAALALAYALACLLTTVLNAILFRRFIHGIRPWLKGWGDFVRRSLAVGVATFFNSVSSRIGITLVTFLAGPFGAGIYAAALRVPQSLNNLPQGIFSAVLPALAAARPDSATFRHLFVRSLALMLMLSLPLAALLSAAAPWLVALIYGDRYTEAVPVLQVLVWGMVPTFVGMAFSHVLLSRQSLVARLPWSAGAGLAGHLGLGLALIPRWGPLGAAWTVVLAETILAIAYGVAAWRAVTGRTGVPQPEPRTSRPRLAVVVQRYGEDVIGGAERAARLVAHGLSRWYEVEVLTTCSRDHQSWANHYSAGVNRDGPVTVRRFDSVQRRHWRVFGWMSGILFRLVRFVRLPAFVEKEWVVQQGPCCPDLLRYLECRRAHYDAFLFFTCLYFPTVFGLPLVKERAVLAPTAHDEPALRFALYRRVLQAPRALVFQSEFEREFVHRRFGNAHLPWVTAGAGVELGEAAPPESWLLFVGRIEVGKGCLELFDAVHSSGLELVVAGPSVIPIPAHVRYEGVVSETRKRELLSCCRAVVVPSVMESLSILALEGWAFGKPVVARRGTAVARMVEECEGGVVFADWSEFGEAVRALRPGMGEHGRKYVAEHFTWEQVVSRYRSMIEPVIHGRSAGGGM